MEKAGTLRGLGGHQWSSFQKVEEMLSKAIRQQQDLRNMLLLIQHSDHGADSPELTAHTLSPHVVRALRVKLENAMDWCHLALCRLKEIISRRYIDHVIPGVQWPSQQAGSGNFFSSFNETSAAQTSCDGGEHIQDAASLITPEDAHGCHRLLLRSLPGSNLGLDSAAQWDMLAGDRAQLSSDLRASSSGAAAAAIEAPMKSPSSSSHMNELSGLVTNLNSSCGRPARPRSCGPKRDREEAGGDEKDTTVSVVFQELKPRDDMKKGIPDDGHRGWKKYGNKAIQNSNFCRGYYKCSMKECGAKKMVQPTDKNPAIFEVTYVGTHTCSSSSTSRTRRHRTSTFKATTDHTTIDLRRTTTPQQQQADTQPSAAAADVLVQTKIARLLIKNQTCSSITSDMVSSKLDNPTNPVGVSVGVSVGNSVGVPTSVGTTSERDVLTKSMVELSRSNLGLAEICSPESVDEGDVGLMRLTWEEEDGEIGAHSLLWDDVLGGSTSWSGDI